ncbi:MAG: 3'-5' exonuclease [Candidatus Binataceae bacterium]
MQATHDPDFALDQLLSELGLGGISGSPTHGNTIKITTVHKAKGLQWPRVYFVGLEEGHLPDHRSDNDPKKMREERRACFVGVCRAEEDLTLTSVDVWGTWTRTRSRFLDQMGF